MWCSIFLIRKCHLHFEGITRLLRPLRVFLVQRGPLYRQETTEAKREASMRRCLEQLNGMQRLPVRSAPTWRWGISWLCFDNILSHGWLGAKRLAASLKKCTKVFYEWNRPCHWLNRMIKASKWNVIIMKCNKPYIDLTHCDLNENHVMRTFVFWTISESHCAVVHFTF